MGASAMPDLANVVIAGGTTSLKGQIAKRERCELLRAQCTIDRSSFIAHWSDLSRNILPRRARFTITDVNKGDKRNSNIIDSTATEAAGTLSAGMMSGITSPARPWFLLGLPDPELAEMPEVKEWLHEVQRIMQAIFLHSNIYNKLPLLYSDIGVFGTSAIIVEDDDETVIRAYDFPLGSYMIANDHKHRVRTFVRAFSLKVQQIVERWGEPDPTTGLYNFQDGRGTTISLAVQQYYHAGNTQVWIPIVHVIQPNVSYDGSKIEAKYLRFESIYYEMGTSTNQGEAKNYGLLEHSGYHEFPILASRWEVGGEDVYATNCPGMRALGDIKQLQKHELRSAQAIEKSINPPLTGPARLESRKVSSLPGDITYDDVREGTQGLRPIYQVEFGRGLKELEEKSAALRERIKDIFKVNLFLMMSQSDRREITAREVDERHEEKLLALGPTLEQLNQDVLDPLISRTFAIANRKNLLPPAPPAIHGQQLRVEYVSIMAQAQRAIGLAGLERFSSFVAQIGQTAPEIFDTVDDEELVKVYAEGTGIPPKVLRHPEQVAQIRSQRQQQQQAQAQAENAAKLGSAAKDAAAAPTGAAPGGGDSVLSTLLAKQRARATIAGTAGPPPSPLS